MTSASQLRVQLVNRFSGQPSDLRDPHLALQEMPPTVEVTAETTLTTARQSSQLLQVLRLVLQGSVRELRRYVTRGGDLNARVCLATEDDSWHVSSEDYTGPGSVAAMPLLAALARQGSVEQIKVLIDAGADPDTDVGESSSAMCCAASVGNVSMMALLHSKGARLDCEGYTPLMTASDFGELQAAKWLVDHGADVARVGLVPTVSGRAAPTSAVVRAARSGQMDLVRFLHAK